MKSVTEMFESAGFPVERHSTYCVIGPVSLAESRRLVDADPTLSALRDMSRYVITEAEWFASLEQSE